MINKRNSNFLYVALGDCKCYALTRKFLHNEFFPKHRDFEIRVKSSVYRFYRKWIYKPINEHREKETKIQNRKTRLFRHVEVRNKLKAETPSVNAFRDHFLLGLHNPNCLNEDESMANMENENDFHHMNTVQFHQDLIEQQKNTCPESNMLDALDQLGQTTKHMSKEVKTLFEVTD